jgi:hypothetical protein
MVGGLHYAASKLEASFSRGGPRLTLEDACNVRLPLSFVRVRNYRVYSHSVTRAFKRRLETIAWVLALLLVYLSVNPPHCNACDRLPSFLAASIPVSIHHHIPEQSDPCNGVCTCCGLLGVVMYPPQLKTRAQTVLSIVRYDAPSPLESSCPNVFHPPRTAISA